MHAFCRFLLCLMVVAGLGAVDVTITRLNTATVNLADPTTRMLQIDVLSGAGTGLISTDLALSGGGTLGNFSGSGPTYFVEWTPPAASEGTAIITVPAGSVDGGNNQAALSIPYDLVAPGTPTFTGLADGDTIGGTTTVSGPVPSGATTVEVNTTAATIASGNWSISLTSPDGPLSITATAIDAFGNDSSVTINVTVDATPPVLTVDVPAGSISQNSAALTVDGTCDDGTATITIVDGATTIPVTNAPGWTVSLSGLAEGIHNLEVRAVDLYGNLATVTRAVTVDTISPSVTLGAPSALLGRTGDEPTILVTFADAGTGLDTVNFSDSDVTVTLTGTASAVAVVDDMADSDISTWRITLTNLGGDGTVRVSLAAALALDEVGNGSAVSALSTAVTVDNTAPTVGSVTPSPGAGSTNPAVAVNIVLSEAAAAVPTLSLNNATASAVTLVSGSTYTVSLTATNPGVFGISSIDATDTAGNAMSDAAGWTVGTYQTGIAATIGLEISQAAVTSTSPIVFEITFAEAIDVATFDASDLVVGGTAGGVKTVVLTADATLVDTVFLATVTGMTTSGTVTLALAGDLVQAADDAEYNAAADASAASVTWTAPTPPPPPSTGGSSSGGGGGGGCGAGTAAGLLIASLGLLGLRRRRI